MVRLASVVLVAVALCLFVAGRAAAEPVTVRFATVAPEGTGWAREFKAFARDASAGPDAMIRMRKAFDAVAG